MNAEILAVGTELLLGNIVNTNSQYLGKRLADLGISVFNHSVVGDNEKRLKKSFYDAFSRAEIVITTGGLGPTKDDLTKEVGSEYFKRELLLDENSLKLIQEYFIKQNRSMNEGNRKQAYIPERAIILPNNNGTAPGCIIENGGKILIMLPGPPKEMIPMFEESVVPFLTKFSSEVIVSKVLRIFGIPEGHMAEVIDDIIENSDNPTVAPYAKENEVTLRLTAKAKNEEEGYHIIKPVEEKIRERIGKYIYGIGDTSLEEVVGKILLGKKLTISTAESCTGGLLAGKIINYPGISECFIQGAITYSNDSKKKILGVKDETLKLYGAVSSETAAEMAEGIAKASNTDIGISTTGIAGPGGGTEEKPVGLVYIGLYINGKVITKKLNLSGNRQKIRDRAVMHALNILREEI